MRAAKGTVGLEAGLAPVAGALQGPVAVLDREAASLTPDPGAGAVANQNHLVGLLPLKRVRNVLPPVDQSLLLLLIARDHAQGQDL